jgi:hypothetical protein
LKARADPKTRPGASTPRRSSAPADPFTRFVDDCSDNLHRIARATRGEHEFGEVVNHAWLLARDLAARSITPDFLDAGFRALLLAHLYQALVRYTDVHVRYADRLDARPAGDEGRPSLSERLRGPERDDPILRMIDDEEARLASLEVRAQGSPGMAWLELIRECRNDMRRVANRLLISRSYAYRCFARTCALATRQLAIALLAQESKFGPWRRFRATRIPRQLAFDFRDGLPFVGEGPRTTQAEQPATLNLVAIPGRSGLRP